ncbi:glycoside hydrolase family 15 protein [Coniophora puteana RWD-64-598 SS2]|uniref:Glucoamylase n=1 Tax=Coniophora puteana (strain RWD-64-598) TaxID=741705 RepID=R7SFT1_CONPW|nr:glycoside hydrolase family 15 protein [Coniophora puteana RWD-64-598 SS2]EIW74710.1 glycoside hydrolase family 15 protein [Coniophora puteana RWD-64-598 SS2]
MLLQGALATLGLCTSVFAQDVSSYISSEGPIALTGVLNNIGPNGSKAPGADAGVVVASPSTSNPNYFYTWIRDSSLTFQVLIDRLVSGQDTSNQGLIDDFTVAYANIQQVTNPSGSVSSGGLGEPKFYVNETAFDGSWGRPQRDGPALRSTAFITYANYLISKNNQTYVQNTLWPAIKLDLDYVAANWNQTTFDLWEEIQSSSFFTTAVQHKALRLGSALASTLGEDHSTYDTQAGDVLCFLQSYWNPSPGYMTANTGGGRSGKDANTVLASIHTFDPAAACDSVTFQPCSDLALSNLKTYVDSFREIYTVNSGISASAAAAVGRYPEDVYQGGNPWYLALFAVAEQLYDALYVWDQQGSLSISDISLGFFKQFDSGAASGSYASSSAEYTNLTGAIKSFADGFIALNAKYTPSGGGLAEQFSRDDGTPTSAVDLTWSYASALTAFDRRAGSVPGSWGAKGLTTSCGQSKIGESTTTSVTFSVNKTTSLGQAIYLTGSVAALSSWSTSNAVLLSTLDYPVWSTTLNLPSSTAITYKYFVLENGQVTWESDPNNSITTAASGSQTLNDTWH